MVGYLRHLLVVREIQNLYWDNMNFSNWTTMYHLCVDRKKRQNLPFGLYYKEIISMMKNEGHRPAIPMAEMMWLEDGQPYYNIHPKLVSQLCRTDLSKIPAVLFKMPHGLRVVHVRFAEEHSEFFDSEDTVHSFLMSLEDSENVLLPKKEAGEWRFGKRVSLILEFGKKRDGFPLQEEFGLELFEDQTFDEAIASTKSLLRKEGMIGMDGKELDINKALLRYETGVFENLLRLAITIGFLADNPAICEADVLNEDREKFRVGDDEQRQLIAERAKRRRKYGFNIGTDLMFVGERPMSTRQNAAETGRELEYAHIRAGHPHAVRYGEGKKLVKIMWYVPLTVRADLPFKSETPTC